MLMRSGAFGRLAVLALALCAVFVVSACGSDSDSPTPTEPEASASDSGGLTKVGLATSSFPVDSTALPYLYPEVFEEYGLDLSVTSTKGGGDTVRAVVSGGIEFGDTSAAAAAQAYLAGAPAVLIGGGGQTVIAYKFIALKDSPLNSIEEMDGQTAGYTSPASSTQAVLNLSLDRAGVENVESRATGGIGEGLTALEGGAIDVAPMVEPLFSSDPDPYKVIWEPGDLIDAYAGSSIMTSADYLESNPDTVETFLEARAAALEAIAADPEDAAKRWGEALKIDPKPIVPFIEDSIAADQWGIGFSLPAMNSLSETLPTLGVEEEVPWAEIINQDHLPEGAPTIDPDEIGQ